MEEGRAESGGEFTQRIRRMIGVFTYEGFQQEVQTTGSL